MEAVQKILKSAVNRGSLPAMFSLGNRITLVTGAASGIGASIAELFARSGGHVYVADRDAKAGYETVARIKAGKGSAEFIELDVTREADCERASKTVASAYGRLDVLVNNAGSAMSAPPANDRGGFGPTLRGERARHVQRTKCFSGMIERRHGVIINLASIGGVIAVRDRLAHHQIRRRGIHQMPRPRSRQTGIGPTAFAPAVSRLHLSRPG
jgi:NAD(P)-dependent dehydrogenase (short-subunit alcohol dehydrogenase family)